MRSRSSLPQQCTPSVRSLDHYRRARRDPVRRHRVDDLEDLQGASFVVFTPLRRAAKSGRLVLFVNDLD